VFEKTSRSRERKRTCGRRQEKTKKEIVMVVPMPMTMVMTSCHCRLSIVDLCVKFCVCKSHLDKCPMWMGSVGGVGGVE
jgi:uncharacterized membrane protein YagU involved in acid resistance